MKDALHPKGMKLGVSGADSTGKSSILQEVVRRLREQTRSVGVVVAGDIARSCPFPLVDRQTAEASHWILERLTHAQEAAALIHDVVLCDRTALDVWVFSNMSYQSGHITSTALEDIERQVREALNSYFAIYCAFIDPLRPVSIGNLPEPEYGGREEFDRLLLKSACRFKADTRIITLPLGDELRVEEILRGLANRTK